MKLFHIYGWTALGLFSLLQLCDTTVLTLEYFRRYPNIGFVDEDYAIKNISSPLQCALQCVSNNTCFGVILDPSCQHMNRRLATGLTFNSGPGVDVLVRRQILLENLEVEPITQSTIYKLCFKAVLVKHGDVRIIFSEQLDLKNESYHFRAKCNNSACDGKFVIITSKYQNVWSQAAFNSYSAYSLEVNEVFDILLLVTTNGVMTYLNGVYLNTLRTSMSIYDVQYIEIGGTARIIEFSV
ncbi:hypothetical protein BgiMline_030184 [Biomphalaria glabrata]|nr:hypothetical protein BgiMline_033234 [Biomphalaria glabrata]